MTLRKEASNPLDLFFDKDGLPSKIKAWSSRGISQALPNIATESPTYDMDIKC